MGEFGIQIYSVPSNIARGWRHQAHQNKHGPATRARHTPIPGYTGELVLVQEDRGGSCKFHVACVHKMAADTSKTASSPEQTDVRQLQRALDRWQRETERENIDTIPARRLN